jgi:hypothetical protein
MNSLSRSAAVHFAFPLFGVFQEGLFYFPANLQEEEGQ